MPEHLHEPEHAHDPEHVHDPEPVDCERDEFECDLYPFPARHTAEPEHTHESEHEHVPEHTQPRAIANKNDILILLQ